MPRALSAPLRKVRRRLPEESVALRAAVLGAVLAGCLALMLVRAISLTTGAALLVVFPFAYVVSYRRRADDSTLVKLALAVAAILALVRFLEQMRGVATLDQVRFPLAELFLWVQVLHSFDLPQRKDLQFSLASSFALLAVAGSLSQDLLFALALGLYFPCAIVALVLSHRSEQNGRIDTFAKLPGWEAEQGAAPAETEVKARYRPSLRMPWREAVHAGLAVLVVAATLFLVIPQPSSARGLAMPFSLGGGIGAASGGGIVNPGFTAGEAGRSSAASYHGFSSSLDLRVRGELSDDLVMRVRASAPAMWKGMIFDNYTGDTWTGDQEEATQLDGGPPYAYPPAFRSLGPRATVTQTFYVEVEQPNVVFAAGQPDNVWIEGGVAVDDLGGLRTPATLTPGAVYSVVSTRGAAGRAELRRATGGVPDTLSRYLQVPSALPPRVGELARRITANASNDLDRVLAIESYLRSNFRYSIDSPVPPSGRDAVDHFLFDAKVGFCEQFASATAVMLRTLGIPARVVAGYAVGRRNPFTGLYEVRASDAHSWVEVWFPGGLGWYEFDPTFDVPPARADISETLPLASVVRALSGALPRVRVPDATRGLLLVGAAATGVLFVVAWIRRRRSRPEEPGLSEKGEAVGPVTRAFLRLEGALGRAGTVRGQGETGRELISRGLGATAPQDGVAAFERERYGATPPPAVEARRAAEQLESAARRVEEEISR